MNYFIVFTMPSQNIIVNYHLVCELLYSGYYALTLVINYWLVCELFYSGYYALTTIICCVNHQIVVTMPLLSIFYMKYSEVTMPFIVLLFCGLLALPPIVLSCCTDFWSSSSSTYIVLDIIPGHFGPLSGRYVIALWILIKPWLPCSLKLNKQEPA